MKLNRISLTIPEGLLAQSEEIAKEKTEDRSTVLRELLSLGIQQYRIEKALRLYMDGKVSLGKAAEMASVSLWKFLDVLKEKKIPLRYDLEDIKKEMREFGKDSL